MIAGTYAPCFGHASRHEHPVGGLALQLSDWPGPLVSHALHVKAYTCMGSMVQCGQTCVLTPTALSLCLLPGLDLRRRRCT